MAEAKIKLDGVNEFHLCEKEAYKAFDLYLERLMPNVSYEIVSVVYHDHQFVVKTKPKGDSQ